MLVEERRKRVLDLVSRKGFATLGDLARSIKASESTLRRDLDHWHQLGLLKRIHGGAMFVGEGSDLPALEERTGSQTGEKQQIARAAAARIQDGDAILLDGGTTTLEVARLLIGRRLQIVTNSLPIANLFASNHETDLVMLGGYVYPKTGVALGPLTLRQMEDIHVHQTILSVGGITANIVDLTALADASFDYASCLFSTLGMVMGASERARVVREVHRLLRPGGVFVLHVHNRWFNIWSREGRRWLLSQILRRGSFDMVMPPHQGLAGLTLHLFTRTEVCGLLRQSGFRLEEIEPLGLTGNGLLQRPNFLSRLRSYGYLLAAKTTDGTDVHG